MSAARNVMAIVEKEWRHYFGSPIAWVVLVVWTFIFGFFFYVAFSEFVKRSAMTIQQMELGGAPPMSLNDWVISWVLQQMAVVSLFLAPMLTMRLFAEEKRQGTIELLATSPVTTLQVVIGKFLGAVGVYAVMILVAITNVLLLWFYATAKPEWKPLLTGMLALLLTGAAFMAIGMFISTLTRNQIVAATITFALALVMWILSWLADPTAGPFVRALAYLGITNHIEDLVKGVVAVKDFVFYLSVISFGLFLAHQSVESQRWRA